MPNRLATERSPYLLQHAGNPVDWYPWGEDAFRRAREENKPVFLSIGYSTCHWCHVMAHESFENAEVAALLNTHFVPVKVDREERPDVDRVYMTYLQAMTGHGGWPLSAWLTPDLKPFFGGTYYPPEDRHGRPGFANLLRSIAQAWAKDPVQLVAEGDRAIEALRAHHAERAGTPGRDAGHEITDAAGEAFEKGFQYYYEAFDPARGGFGGSPKFPRASNLSFLLRIAAIQGADTEAGAEALRMTSLTLQRMAEGGIHDHVGGGYHRYAVDEGWFVPHFEKMLYDQAQIALNFLDAHQASGREVFLWQARDILGYVERDLRAPGGAFYSAEDADSPTTAGGDRHAEGAYYVWTAEQIAEALRGVTPGAGSPPLAASDLIAFHFGIQTDGNVPAELDPHGEFRGRNILKQAHTLAETAQYFGLGLEQANALLATALDALRAARLGRPRPHLDDKIITAWNGLMISAFARASQRCRAASDGATTEAVAYAATASAAAGFIRTELYDAGTGILYRVYRQGRTDVAAFAEDYAFLIQGLIDLYEATFAVEWLRWADALQQTMDRLFWDADGGAYFSSRGDDPSILLRLKEDYDGAEPAPSSVAAMNLLRLAVLDGPRGEREERALRTLNALRPQWSRLPHALPQALCALEHALISRRQVVIAGDPASPAFQALWQEALRGFGPRRALLAADGGPGQAWLGQRLPWLGLMTPVGGAAASAYVCEHHTCLEPSDTPEALRAQLT